MKWRRFIIPTGLIILLAVVLFRSQQSPVRHKGKSIEFWFAELGASGTQSNEAKAAFLTMGSGAVPFLTARLTYSGPLRNSYLLVKKHLPIDWRRKLPSTPRIDWSARNRAAWMLGELGTEARSALPSLSRILSHSEEIENFGGNATSARTWDPRLRAEALNAIEKIGFKNRAVFESVVLVALSPQTLIRGVSERAAQILENAPELSESDIQFILSSLERINQRSYYRELQRFPSAMTPGGTIGHLVSHQNSESNTLRALRGDNAAFREAAAFELGDIDREGFSKYRTNHVPKISAEAAAELVKCLSLIDEPIRLNAADSLLKTKNTNTAVIVQNLLPLLESTNSFRVLRSIEILRILGTNARPAIPTLRELTSHHPTHFVSVWAGKAVHDISGIKP
jgi:hypothetical protein